MNTALGFEIYRGVWFIAGSNDVFNNMLRDAKTAIYDPSQKLNTFAVKSITSKNGVPTPGTGITLGSDANNTSSSSDKKIAVVNLSGVITKSGGASSKGMEEISAEMLAADTDPNVIGHLIKVNSPGGSGVAMNYMKSTMKMLTKPKVTLVPRQGMAASAGYGILCEGDWVMAESDDAEVGCHGVMWGASGVPNGQKDGNGEVNFIVVSSTSPDKNKAQFVAINNNDTSLMQAEVDKLHQDFKASTLAVMPTVKDEQMTGEMYLASEVVGTMLNAIGTEQDAINKILELSNTKINFSTNLKKPNKNAMTKAQLLSEHPELHAEIFGAGVQAEKDRVDTWMVYHDIDPVAVQAGIESGNAVTTKEMAAFNLKAASAGALNALKKDSKGDLLTQEAVAEVVEDTRTAQQKADQAEYDAAFPRQKGKVDLSKTTFKEVLNPVKYN